MGQLFIGFLLYEPLCFQCAYILTAADYLGDFRIIV